MQSLIQFLEFSWNYQQIDKGTPRIITVTSNKRREREREPENLRSVLTLSTCFEEKKYSWKLIYISRGPVQVYWIQTVITILHHWQQKHHGISNHVSVNLSVSECVLLFFIRSAARHFSFFRRASNDTIRTEPKPIIHGDHGPCMPAMISQVTWHY